MFAPADATNGCHTQQNLKGGFAEGGGIFPGFGGLEFCCVGSPKHVENLGIHRTIIKQINFVRGMWDRGYKAELEVLMICEWHEYPGLSDYVNGDITRTVVNFRKCGMPQETGARSKHRGRP